MLKLPSQRPKGTVLLSLMVPATDWPSTAWPPANTRGFHVDWLNQKAQPFVKGGVRVEL